MGENLSGNFCLNSDFHVNFGIFYVLYFPSEGRPAEDFFRPKNPTASAGFEPANLGTKGQHATARPPRPLLNSNVLKIPSNILLTFTPRFSVIFSFSGKILCVSVIGVTWLKKSASGLIGGGGKRGQASLQCCFYLRNYFCFWIKGGGANKNQKQLQTNIVG